MNVFLNLFSNSISVVSTANKKMPVRFELSFPYSIKTTESKIKAINEVLGNEQMKKITNDKNVSLIISDDMVFISHMSFPSFSSKKLSDAFETKFKISYPNFESYFLHYSHYEKTNANSIILYSMANADNINKIKDAFAHNNLEVKNIQYFSNVVTSLSQLKKDAITIKLFVGSENSEVIISKGGTVIGHSIINLGENLLKDKEYLDSSYNYQNDIAKKYASFHKTNFDSKDILTDELIQKNEIHVDYIYSKPREVRVIKDDQQTLYNQKQNYRKFHGQIMDIVEYYTKAPWFFPIREIRVSASDEVFESLVAANQDQEIAYTKGSQSIDSIVSVELVNDKLFTNILKQKERRKIDWAKILSMEIGKKKKA